MTQPKRKYTKKQPEVSFRKSRQMKYAGVKDEIDCTPMAIPVGATRPESLAETMARFIKIELSNVAEANEMETFEESEDFEIEDEGDTLDFSTYEFPEIQDHYTPPENPTEAPQDEETGDPVPTPTAVVETASEGARAPLIQEDAKAGSPAPADHDQ